MEKLFCFVCGIAMFTVTACFQESTSEEQSTGMASATSSPSNEWNELQCGLYIHSSGDIGFPTEPDLVFIPPSEIYDERSICPNNFLTHLGDDTSKQLKLVVDTTTFEAIGTGFYKDKNNIYSHYAVCDAGTFSVFAEDTASFKLIGNSYAHYQSKIYHHRLGLMDTDPASFKSSAEFGQAAKDKDGFFSFGERITAEALQQEMGEEMFNRFEDL